MPVLTRRTRALPFVVVAGLLLTPAAANAAMGGANALTTSLRPDLRSATVQSTNAVDDTTTVRACFNKAIASLPQAALFHIGTYQDDDPGDDINGVSATRSSANCADAVFPDAQATQFTYLTVDGSDGTAPDSGGSAVATNGFGNIRDSTALIGSKTNAGTRGFTTAPDLVGIAVNNAQAFIDYTFDEQVGAISTAANDFQYNLPTGVVVNSLAGAANRAISADGLTVRAFFPAATIAQAVRGIADNGAVDAKTGGDSNPLRSAARPGSGGFTDRPDLVAIIPSADGSTVDFQFDQVLTAQNGNGNFHIVDSFSTDDTGTGATIVGGVGVGNTVRVTFAPSGPQENEFWTSGWVDAGGVTGAGGTSTAGGLPAGGNVGAFATGFTIAPEALTVSFDNATDVASVLFDQRWQLADENDFKLIDDQGSQISAAALNVTGTGSPTAGKITAQVTFPAGTLAGARSLLLQQNAVEVNTINFGPLGNRPQVISPTAPAAKTNKKFRSVKLVRKNRAAVRRAVKRH
jgi:hypothetical protein